MTITFCLQADKGTFRSTYELVLNDWNLLNGFAQKCVQGGRAVGRSDWRSDMDEKTELSDSGEGERGERDTAMLRVLEVHVWFLERHYKFSPERKHR
jgi:hypothetical protein